jgi:catechol 2,3-dioxygenase-like lactoylglutathione lyase family enzyme
MSNKPKAIPDGYHNVTPYLIVNDAAAAIEFYKKAFGATELMRMPKPNGKIGHAEIRIGDSPIMLADEAPEMGARSPRTFGQSMEVPRCSGLWPTSSTEIGPAEWKIRSGMYGTSQHMWRTYLPRK